MALKKTTDKEFRNSFFMENEVVMVELNRGVVDRLYNKFEMSVYHMAHLFGISHSVFYNLIRKWGIVLRPNTRRDTFGTISRDRIQAAQILRNERGWGKVKVSNALAMSITTINMIESECKPLTPLQKAAKESAINGDKDTKTVRKIECYPK